MTDDNDVDISKIIEELNDDNYAPYSYTSPRDVERIDKLLTELRAYWLSHPDLRLGQIVSRLSNDAGHGDDPFYMEDDIVLQQLQEYNDE